MDKEQALNLLHKYTKNPNLRKNGNSRRLPEMLKGLKLSSVRKSLEYN